MPWAETPENTLNQDLYVQLFPLSETELKTTVTKCASPLTTYRSCMSSAPITLEDWEVLKRCEDVLSNLKRCSERVVLESKKKDQVMGGKVEARDQARFLMKGHFDGA